MRKGPRWSLQVLADAGIKPLGELKNLEYSNLSYTKIYRRRYGGASEASKLAHTYYWQTQLAAAQPVTTTTP